MTREHPLISIGLPVYNGDRYLEAALDSLLAQTYQHFELIICDNASTDRTEAIAREYVARDPRVRYHRAPRNVGAARNYQLAFEQSSSAYFKWATADDLVAPEFLERCVDAIRRDEGVVLVYPRTRLIDGEGAAISDYNDNVHLTAPSAQRRFVDVMERLGLCNVIYGVMRSDVLRRCGRIGSFVGSDCVLIAELALHGRFHEVPEVLFSRRMHASAYSSQVDPARRDEFYNPHNRRRVGFVRWRQLLEYARAVERSPVPFRERARLRLHLLRSAVWDRHHLAAEAWAGVVALCKHAKRRVSIATSPTSPSA